MGGADYESAVMEGFSYLWSLLGVAILCSGSLAYRSSLGIFDQKRP